MRIGSRDIHLCKPSYIIAEIGVNHEGNFDICKKMISKASKSGADAVKLQTFDPAQHYLPGTESYRVYENTSFSYNQIEQLFKYAQDLKIDIFSTCGDIKTIDFINKLNPVAFKISSGMIENYPIIKHLIKTDKPLIFSTGMSTYKEIDVVMKSVKKAKRANVALMHCISLYPVPKSKINLLCIKTLKEKYKIDVGFSDHSLGPYASELAVAMGARIIEKHFTLDNKRDSFDHKISLTPTTFSRFVKKIRNVEVTLGDGEKKISNEEELNALKYKRYIVANKLIKAGKPISLYDISLMRVENSNGGLSASYLEKIHGKKLKSDIKKFQLIKKTDIS